MSRIGKLPVVTPGGVDVKVEGLMVSVSSGAKRLDIPVNPAILVEQKDGKIFLTRKNEEQKSRAWHGLYRMLIHNAVVGVTKGWEKVLILNGVGYKASVKGKTLELILGFSHPVKLEISPHLEVKVEKNTEITVKGADKSEVGQFCARIRGLRPPEPYLGKGIKFKGEVIRRKAGKSGAKK